MSKISQLAVLATTQPDDVLPVVDVHDLTMAATGTTKKIAVSALVPALVKVADAGTSGVALVNGTQNFCSWTVPSDGNLHPFIAIMTLVVTTATQVGGAVGLTAYTNPAATALTNFTLLAGGQGVGTHLVSFQTGLAYPGSTLSLGQTSAMTSGGPAAGYAQLWAI